MEDEKKTKKQLIEELNALRLEQIEQTRITSEKFTKAFIQSSIPTVITSAKDGRAVEVSDAFLRLVGLKRHEVIGRTMIENGFITREQREIFFNEFKKSGYIKDLEMEITPKGRGLKYALFNAVIISINNENYLQVTLQPINDRKKAEKELRDSEERFRILFNSGKDYMAVHLSGKDGRPGNFIQVNDAACEILGYTREEMLKLTHQDVDLAKSSEQMSALIEKLIKNKSILYETEIITKNGDRIPMEVSLNQFLLNGNQATMCVARDITERKQMEKILAKSEEKFRLITENITDCISLVDKHGIILYMTNSLEILGYEPEELIGTTGRSLTHPDDQERMSKIRQDGINQVWREMTYETKLLHKDGHYVPMEVRVRIFTDSQGKIIGFVGSGRDITERKQAEKELRASEEKFRLLFNCGKDYTAVHLTGKDGQPGNFIQVNDAACEILGYTREEMLKLSPQDVDSAESSGQTPALIEKLIEDKHILFETEMMTKNGDRIPMEVSLTLFQLHENQATICVARNMTERKKADKELHLSETKYRKLHQSMRDAFVSVDMAGNIQDYNESYLNMLGYASEEINTLNYKDITPEKWHMIEADIVKNQILTEGYSHIYEKEYRRKDGTVFPVELRTTLITDTEGVPIGMWAIVRDITERNRRGKELRESEVRFRMLAENAQDMIYRMSLPDGKYEYVNPASFDLNGFSPEEHYNGTVQLKNLIHPDFSSYLNEQWEKLLQGEVADSYEYKIIHKDGSERWLQQRNSLVYDERGSAIAIEGIVSDITGSKIKEETLKKSQEKYRLIVNNIMDCIFLVDKKGIILHVTNSRETLGYEPEELIGNSGLSITHPDDLERVTIIHHEGVNKLWREITYETRLLSKDGHYVPMEIRVRILTDSRGEFSGSVSAGREIIQDQQKKRQRRSDPKSALAYTELKSREKEVLNWVMQGKSTWDIGKIINLRESTVKFHIDKIMKKLHAVNRTHAVAIAMQNELLD